MNHPTPSHLSRRDLLQMGAGLIGTGSLTLGLGKTAFASPITPQRTNPQVPPQGKTDLSPDEALKQLMAGNQRFVSKKRDNPHQDFVRIAEVAKGQFPFAAILGCADSRVVPEILFDQGIGDLFTVRVAGNIANIEDIASEEFAVAILNTPLLMVLGHKGCGAVTAALKGGDYPGLIESLVVAIQPALKASEGQPGDRLANAVKANVRLQVQRLQTSPVIASAMKADTLNVVGAYYDLDTGEVSMVS
jgi:carbonic anhydrase